MGEFALQTFMMLRGCGKPHAIIRCVLRPVPEDQNNLILNVNCQTPEHEAGPGRQWAKRLKHERMRHSLAPFTGEQCVVQWLPGGTAITP